MHYGFGGFAGMGGLGMILFWILIVAVVIVLVRSLSSLWRSDERRSKSPMEILDKKYAEGKIDRKEYEQKKHGLVEH